MKKIVMVTSSGGHLIKSVALKDWWSQYQRVWVTRKDSISQDLLQDETVYWGFFPENRNRINFVRNMYLAIKVFITEKPDYLFSTGAGVAVPFFLIGKFLPIKRIFVETFITIPKPTLSGQIIYRLGLASDFIVQHPDLCKKYPKAVYKGSIL